MAMYGMSLSCWRTLQQAVTRLRIKLSILWGQQMYFLIHDYRKASTSKTLRVQDKPSPNTGQTDGQWQSDLKNHLTTGRFKRAKEDWACRRMMWHCMLEMFGSNFSAALAGASQNTKKETQSLTLVENNLCDLIQASHISHLPHSLSASF